MTDNRRRPPWKKEWENIKAATGNPRPGSRFTKLLSFLDITPTPYGILWRRAFDTDPFLRTEMRKWAKAGVIDRIVDIDGFTELWSLPKESAGQIKEIDLFADYGLCAAIDRPLRTKSLVGPNTQYDQPKLLSDPKARDERLRQIMEPHVASLTGFVQKLRRIYSDLNIPYFDPWDGGIQAEVLFLQEAPGPKAIYSGFVSRNNPDETAKNFFEISMSAGLSRERTVRWNIVPWYIGTGNKIRAAKKSDVLQGMEPLFELLKMLPNLRVIVLMGEKAQMAAYEINVKCPDLRIFKSPHASPLFCNRKPENKNKILSVFKEVVSFLDDAGAGE